MRAHEDGWVSGKGHRDENFPVASRLIDRRHRAPILAFYRFARAADDAADHATLTPDEKLSLLDRMEATLFGEDTVPAALPLREALERNRLTARHPLDLLTAFRRDVETSRTQTLAELMDYCAVSAMPVGRFVLDVHGEDRATWEASDALCAALQIINHLQDCGRDYRELDRVYIPLDRLAAHGSGVEDLGREHASQGLKRTIAELLSTVEALLAVSARLAREVRNVRLRMEIAAIQKLAESLTARLAVGDPLRGGVHLSKPAMLALTLSAAAGQIRGLLKPGSRGVRRGTGAA